MGTSSSPGSWAPYVMLVSATCRVIARSAELRVFLEERGELRSSQAWLALHFPAPTWIQGVQRLLKQVVGKQTITPAPSEAARATAASHDVVRSVREALHSYRSNQCVASKLTLHPSHSLRVELRFLTATDALHPA